MHIHEPKMTAVIVASGKMVIGEAKLEDDSCLASRKYTHSAIAWF